MRNRCILGLLGAGLFGFNTLAAPLPDPTRPVDFIGSKIELPIDIVDWVVNGITISSQARSAIVNGVVVVPGQHLGDAIVVDIQDNTVVLEYNGERLNVYLRSQSVKHPASN